MSLDRQTYNLENNLSLPVATANEISTDIATLIKNVKGKNFHLRSDYDFGENRISISKNKRSFEIESNVYFKTENYNYEIVTLDNFPDIINTKNIYLRSKTTNFKGLEVNEYVSIEVMRRRIEGDSGNNVTYTTLGENETRDYPNLLD
jgi:hypothetical protein